MDFIATYWWAWLAMMILSFGYAVSFQIKKTRDFMEKDIVIIFRGVPVERGSLTSDWGKMAAAGFIGSASAILLIISIIIHIIRYCKG